MRLRYILRYKPNTPPFFQLRPIVSDGTVSNVFSVSYKISERFKLGIDRQSRLREELR